MGFFKKIKKRLGFSRLSDIDKVVDKQLKSLDPSSYSYFYQDFQVFLSDVMTSVKKINKKYSDKKIENSTIERLKYWSKRFNKSRNLQEIIISLFSSSKIKSIGKTNVLIDISKKTFFNMLNIRRKNIFCFGRRESWPFFVKVMHFLENNELIEQKHKNYTLRQYMILSVKSQKLDDLIALREAFKCEVDAFLDDPNNEKIRTFLDDVNKKNEEKIKIENSLKELKNKINVIEKTKTKEEIEKNFVRFLNSYFDSKNGEGDTHKTVKYFLEQDIDINMKTKNGSTLLISALSKKHKEVVRTLLKEGRGLNINIQNASGLTPLMFAMETDQEEMAMELLKSDYGDYIDVNLKEEHGYTPLMVAASQGWDKIVEELLKKKDINVNSQNSNGSTALMLAIYGRHEKTAEIILNKSINKIDLNIQNNHKNHKDTALILAVRKNNLRIVEKMVENIQKIEINKIDGNGRTALNYAEEPEMVYLLASKGGLKSEDINSGKTALIAAIRGNAFGRDKQRNAIVKNLLLLTKTEEELDVTDDLGYTPLMYAVTEENMEAVEMLLEKVEKMNINKESGKCRRTALDIAEGQNNRDIANLLKAKGAQMSEARKEKALIKEKLKEDQEDIEFKNKEKELSKKTEQKVKNETDNNGNVPLTEDKAKSIDVVTSYKLSLAILDGNEKLLKELLKKADKEVKNKKDKYGYTPLSTAIRKENLDAVKILVKDEEIEIKLQELISSISINGKDDIFNELLENAKKEIINGTDEQGQTMLMYASRTKKLSIVEKLLKYEEIKKEINKTNGDKTALDYAEDFEDAEAENAEIINLLKEHGAIRGKTKEGKKTKLTIAVENGNSNAVTELLEDQDIKVSVDDLDTAIINFKENIFKKLLEKADKEVKNKKNKYGDTPLSTAIRKENLDAVKILVKDEEIEIKLKELISSISINRKDDIFNELLENAKKEIINGTDEQGQTMLMCASRTMKLSIVEKLLKYEEIKKEINKTNGDKTALDYAEDFEDAEAKNAEIINLLKEHGAIRGKTKEGKKTKLTIAIENGNSNAVTELLEDQDIKVSVGDLKAAIINFKENIFKKLLEKSEKQVKNAKGPNGNTALGNALFFGKLDALKILSEDEDVEINFDELIMAVRSNDKNILEMLLKRSSGKLKNGKNILDGTLLQYSMKNNRLGMTDILLNDKEIKINFHELIKAIDINNKNIFEKLLKNADDKLKNEKNKKNETLLKYAINLNNPGMVDVLLKDKKIKVTMNELIEATFPGKEQFLEPLLEKIDEKEKNENDRFTYNLLSNTIHYGNSNALKILLKNEKIKKEINQIHGNKSLLDLAESKAEGKNSEIINLLRSNGAVETPKK